MKNANVVISPSPIKTSDRINLNGDTINPETKQIIKKKEVYIPPPQATETPPPAPPQPPQPPVTSEIPKDDGLSVLEQISATKKKLKDLEELKKLKIAQKKKELELLEN
ncbi:MAG TPA: hypothetical protein ENG81_01060 [Candidatus Bathyarchaeota archaeon]|nr:hypothetical protein [Candidatus Bathyarchaeota archaeon]